jgi:hypothetical protein
LQKVLQESAALCESLAAQGKVDLTAWTAWCAILKSNLQESAAVELLLNKYETAQNDKLPSALEHLTQHPELQGIIGADVLMIVKRFCELIERLRLIDKMMLKRDQPLKPALLMFALLHKKTRDLLAQAEQTLTILPLGTQLQETLDGVIYVVPMELRKVFSYELVRVRQFSPVWKTLAVCSKTVISKPLSLWLRFSCLNWIRQKFSRIKKPSSNNRSPYDAKYG